MRGWPEVLHCRASLSGKARGEPQSGPVASNRLRFTQQVLQHREGGTLGMGRLGNLRELLRVAEEDDIVGRGRQSEWVGEGGLTGLIDEEVVQLLGVSAAVVPRRGRR